MKVSELKERKRELGYSNEKVAELSGVPLGTVQKIFGGATSAPRYETLKKIERALFPEGQYNSGSINYADVINSSNTDEPVLVRDASQLAYYGYNNTAYAGKKQGEYTVEDWYALPDGTRMELIDGRLYDLAPPSVTHQHLAGQLYVETELAIRSNGSHNCLPLISPVGVQLTQDSKNMLMPDVLIVCDNKKFDAGKRVVYGAPDFIAEVLSPSTAGYDRLLKLNKYWEGGVIEYWIVDPVDEVVIVYNFESGRPPVRYSFDEVIPIGISDGTVSIDFPRIMERLRQFFVD